MGLQRWRLQLGLSIVKHAGHSSRIDRVAWYLNHRHFDKRPRWPQQPFMDEYTWQAKQFDLHRVSLAELSGRASYVTATKFEQAVYICEWPHEY